MIANLYHQGNTREVCHGIKERDNDCISIMIDYIMNYKQIRAGDILIPAPQHEGYAIYTKLIAEGVSDRTGAIVKDIIRSNEREMLYQNRNANLFFYKTENIDCKSKIYFVDNVIATGKTYREVCRLMGQEIEPLVYGIV